MGKSWLKDSTFRPFGDDDDPISIRVTETDSEGTLGTWNLLTSEVKVAPGQTPEQQLVVLIHELLHCVETRLMINDQMSRKVNHTFITNGSFAVAAALVHAGVIRGITPKAWDSFWASQEEL